MKRKVRVYNLGGSSTEYKCGGSMPKMHDGGHFSTTQDSNPDNIAGQKTNNFIDWLKQSSENAILKQQLDDQKKMQAGMAQDGYSMTKQNIPEYLDPNRNLKPGARVENYGKKTDPGNALWLEQMNKMQSDWNTPLNTFSNMALQASRPATWELDLEKGQTQQDIFTNSELAGYANPELSTFDITGVKKDGNKRSLTYNATGTQKYLGDQPDPNYKPYYQQPEVGPEKSVPTNFSAEDETFKTTHGQLNYADNINQAIADKYGTNSAMIPGLGMSSFDLENALTNKTWIEQNPDIVKMLGNFALGGALPKAQYGNFPDLNAFATQSQDYNVMNNMALPINPIQTGSTHGDMDFLQNLNLNLAQQAGTPSPEFAPREPLQNEQLLGDRDISEQGELNLRKVSGWEQATRENPYLPSMGIIAGMQALSNIGNMDEQAEQERAIRERVSNVHRLYGTQGADRGDYMVNAPGVGDFLKPDQHTRMGYNTKIAQQGYEINSEVDLSEEEIQKLIAQGYDLEFLD